MAQITVEEVYRGEKYGVMSAAMAEYLTNGHPAEYDERTWVEMLIVKHALIAADKMKLEGDSISGMTDAESPSSYVRWDEHDNALRHDRPHQRGDHTQHIQPYYRHHATAGSREDRPRNRRYRRTDARIHAKRGAAQGK